MKVRAVAVASERSNAIGSVELECTPYGLVMIYLGMGSFAEGYAPVALTAGTRVVAPWASIEEARVEGEQLYLALDAAVTPHNRLTLTHFTTGDRVPVRESGRQRLVVRIGAIGAALVTALVIGVALPRAAPRAGAALAILVAITTALAILMVGLLADRRLASTPTDGAPAREAFAVDLSTYLPSLVRLPRAPLLPTKPLSLPTFQGLLPRTTLAIVITLTACTLGAVLMAQAVLRARERPEPRAVVQSIERAHAASEPPAAPAAQTVTPATARPTPAVSAASIEAPPGDTAAISERCVCKRAGSVLWQKPIPKLGVLVLSRKIRQDGRRKELDIEVAAVNNGDADVSELSMMIHFFERDPPPSNRRYEVQPSAVYFQGPLGPGKAIKWSVEGRGSEFEVENPIPGDIGPGGDGAAPTNLLAELLEANHRPVRLHGAMMLAYLGDPRAKEAVLKLREALRDDEAPYLERVNQALNDVRTCDLDVKGSGSRRSVDVCVHNTSDEPKKDLALRLRALAFAPLPSEPVALPPEILAETSWKIPGELAPQAGAKLRVSFDLDTSSDTATEPSPDHSPPAFEAHADRIDLLR